jgi:hypoxanthine phosphoribosyltransferase
MVEKLYVTYNEVRLPAYTLQTPSPSRLPHCEPEHEFCCCVTPHAARVPRAKKAFHDAARSNERLTAARLQVHKLCQESAPHILSTFKPQLMIAIGGGGYVPARILRSFLKQPGSPNIPIQAIGLSLYESLSTTDAQVEEPGTKVTRTQWLDLSSLGEMADLVGKRVLIVDEVDDTRTTLEYAVKELEKDVEVARSKSGGGGKAEFSIFVLHVSIVPLSCVCAWSGMKSRCGKRAADWTFCCRTRTRKRRARSRTT